MIKKILKITFFIVLFAGTNFISFGAGRLTKNNDILDKCLAYHAALTDVDAEFTCKGIMLGVRWPEEVLVPGVHGDPEEDVRKTSKRNTK